MMPRPGTQALVVSRADKIVISVLLGRFRAPWPSNSEEWGELACDVIEGLTMFCL